MSLNRVFFYLGYKQKKNGTTTPGSITTSGNDDICMKEIDHDPAKIERLLQN